MRRGLIVLLFLFGVFHGDAAEPRRYRLTLKFSGPDFRCFRTVTYRDEFHLILDKAPLGDGYWGSVAGVIYPENGSLYASLFMSKLRDKSEVDGAVLGRISHVKLPPNLSVSVPMTSGDFTSCVATFEPIK